MLGTPAAEIRRRAEAVAAKLRVDRGPGRRGPRRLRVRRRRIAAGLAVAHGRYRGGGRRDERRGARRATAGRQPGGDGPRAGRAGAVRPADGVRTAGSGIGRSDPFGRDARSPKRKRRLFPSLALQALTFLHVPSSADRHRRRRPVRAFARLPPSRAIASRRRDRAREKSTHPGGNVVTIERDGFRIECGPNGIFDAKPHTLQLCHDLGLGDRLIPASEHSRKNRYPVPRRPAPALAAARSGRSSRLRSLSWRGKLNLLVREIPQATGRTARQTNRSPRSPAGGPGCEVADGPGRRDRDRHSRGRPGAAQRRGGLSAAGAVRARARQRHARHGRGFGASDAATPRPAASLRMPQQLWSFREGLGSPGGRAAATGWASRFSMASPFDDSSDQATGWIVHGRRDADAGTPTPSS